MTTAVIFEAVWIIFWAIVGAFVPILISKHKGKKKLF